MSDPNNRRFGPLICTALVTVTPVGEEAAYLLVAASDERARVTMPPVAEALGLDPRPGAFTPRVTGAIAEIDDDVVYLKDAGVPLLACRTLTAGWAALACENGRVVLVVGYAPMPVGMPVETYGEQIVKSGQLVVGLVPLA